jgi:exopolysaccharide production protein ExoY
MTQKVTLSDVGKIERLKTYTRQTPQIRVRHDFAKRLFDILFSMVVLVFSSPLLIVLTLLVRLTSKGPIFYTSKRIGRGGKIIGCLKFRTMFEDAEERLHHLLQTDHVLRQEWETYQKFEKDPRITPVGHFLRKTSLDEFPQFWNVLKGELSVVGPRPPTLMGPPEQFMDEIQTLYGDKTANILSVRPGITGLWQTSGRSKIPFEERCILEERYATTRNFWMDLYLILKTIPTVLFSRGAF